MSIFPTSGSLTLKSTTIPSAFVELAQRAFAARENAPQGFSITVTPTQATINISATIPMTSKFMGGIPMLEPKHIYSGTAIDMDDESFPTGWKLAFPDGSGSPMMYASYSSALVALGQIVKDAERTSPAPAGQGITAISFNEATEVFSITAAIPVSLSPASNGVLQLPATDYLGDASYATLMGI